MFAVKDPRQIERIPISHTDNIEAEIRADVLSKAHKLLGYSADEFSTTGPLAKTLSSLSIAPLDADSVDRYMKSKEKKWRTHHRFSADMGVGLFSPLLCLYLTWYGHFRTDWFKPENEGGAWFIIIGASIVLAFVSNAIWHWGFDRALTDRKFTQFWAWHTLGHQERYHESGQDITPYKRYVPVHLLNYATQIKEQLPDAKFYIRELTVISEEIKKPLPDPFLLVQLGSERYAIGVWDEREYEAKA